MTLDQFSNEILLNIVKQDAENEKERLILKINNMRSIRAKLKVINREFETSKRFIANLLLTNKRFSVLGKKCYAPVLKNILELNFVDAIKRSNFNKVGSHGINHLTVALFEIAKNGDDDFAGIIYLLVKSGANVNAQDVYGETPLHHAHDDEIIAKALIAAGAEKYIRDCDGELPYYGGICCTIL